MNEREALQVIASMPMPEQDNMVAANMRKIAADALAAQPAAEPTDAMVDAYLQAQRSAVEEADRFGRPNMGGLHTNTVREACRAGLKAAIAAAQPARAGGDALQGLSAYLRAEAGGVTGKAEQTLRQWAAAVDALAAAPQPAAPTLMTEAQAGKWAWNQVRQEVGTEGWTAGDSCTFFGFFMHGWRYRGQYELQRRAALAMAVPVEQPAASTVPATERQTQPLEMFRNVQWPKAREVGRIGDMSLESAMRVGLDNDNDVYVSVHNERGGGDIEFCTPFSGGGKSPRTREALIALMVAMEADNAEVPAFDWWARRNGIGSSKEGGDA